MLTEDLKKKIGQFFMIRFEGHHPTPEVEALIKEWGIGGVVLFASNCVGVKKTQELILHLKSLSKDSPLCVAIDHEGGRVHRLPKPVTRFPPLKTLGKLYERMPSSTLASEVGHAMGRELKALGIDLNFAPVVDVHTNPFNPVIGDRSAGSNPEIVSLVAGQLIQGLQGEGVSACVKHFPGHGDTNEDSHHVLPSLPHNLKRLRSMELIPFQTAIQKGVASIMTAHVVYDGIDKGTPATFSVKILRDILRTELGFNGLIISDDLSMGAIGKNCGMEEGCVKAFLAGCDIVLALCEPKKIGSALNIFASAIGTRKIPFERVEKSLQRIIAFKERFCAPGGVKTPNLGVIGSQEHQYLLNKIKQLA